MSSLTLNAFDNPVAQEWVADFLAEKDFYMIEEVLTSVVDVQEGYLEQADAQRAMAALEILAGAMLRPTAEYLENTVLAKWVQKKAPDIDREFVRLAHKALSRIVSADSELREAWEDSDDLDSWLSYVYDLRDRLTRQ